MNGRTALANRILRPSDDVTITRPFGRMQRVIVKAVADKHLAKADARLLYDDVTPAPSAEEIEQRRLERVYRAAMSPRAPDKRERRQLRRLKGRD